MYTLGDLTHQLRTFFSLERSATLAARRPAMTNPLLEDRPAGGLYHTYHNWDDLRKERLALHTSWVYAAVRRIGLAALPAKVQIERRQAEELVAITNHPLELLFQRPNPFMSREYLWLFTHFSMQLSGKAFWFLYPDRRGRIAELWPVPHHLIRPIPDMSPQPERLFSEFRYTSTTGQEMSVPVENVIYLRFPDPFDPYLAWSPLKAGSLAMILDRSQANWNTTTFDKNKGLPTNVISVAPETGDTDFRTFKADLKKRHGENLTVRGGQINVQRLGMTNEEAQYLESREFNQREINEVFGLPPEASSEEGMKEVQRRFINYTVWPYLEFLAGWLTSQLVVPYFGDNLVASFTDIRPQDRALEVQEATQYWPSLTNNETRLERGFKPLPPLMVQLGEAEINLWEDVPIRALPPFLGLISNQMQAPPEDEGYDQAPTAQDSASPAQIQELEERQAAGLNDNEPEEEPVRAAGPPGRRGDVRAMYADWESLAVKRWERGSTPALVYLAEDLDETDSYVMAAALGLCRSEAEIRNLFAHREAYTLPAVRAILGEFDEVEPERLALEQETVPALLEFLADQVNRIVSRVALLQARQAEELLPAEDFWQTEVTATTRMVTPYVEKWAEAGIAQTVIEALTPVGLGLDVDVNARAAAWAGEHALELAKGLTKTTRELSKAKIKNWLQTGEPLETLNKSLAQVISPKWRAEMIAATEVTRAWAEVRSQIAEEYEVIVAEVWLTANDELVCPICRPLNGERKPVGGTFPGGLKHPPAHPRCRCGTSFEV